MIKVDCDVIKDLLPSYIDKISSNATNELVKEHLSKCQKCQKTLKEMDCDLTIEKKENQNNQIDYLKKFKKNKAISILFTVFVTIDIIIFLLISLHVVGSKLDFKLNINDIEMDYSQSLSALSNNENGENQTLTFTVIDKKNKYDLISSYYTEGNSMYVKFIGKFPFGKASPSCISLTIDKTIDSIYIKDDYGNMRKVWVRTVFK